MLNRSHSPEIGKEKMLFHALRGMGSVLVAFSGGVDSSYLAYAARNALDEKHTLAVTARSPSLPSLEGGQVENLACKIGIRHEFVETREFDNPRYRANPSNRCYFCKTALYETLVPLAETRGLKTVVNGLNADDRGDYRPGVQAASERGVRSPLLEADMTKGDIRALSRKAGLLTADMPASACLASRIPYGQDVTRGKLSRIDKGEAFLRRMGFSGARVRHHTGLARIEFRPEDLPRVLHPNTFQILSDTFHALGFDYVAVDTDGYRRGSLNAALPQKTPRLPLKKV